MKVTLRILSGFFIVLGLWLPFAWVLANFLVVEKPLDHADAILVLSGSASYIERTNEAAALFKKGIAPKIILTNDEMQGGWDQEEQRNPTFAELARRQLVRQGVPDLVIETLPPPVYGTNDEAYVFAEMAAERKMKSILLVTSAYHSRRALWTFDRAISRNNLVIVIGIESPARNDQTLLAWSWWFRRQGLRSIGLEYVKLAYYWTFY